MLADLAQGAIGSGISLLARTA